jgi:hypothetical protein
VGVGFAIGDIGSSMVRGFGPWVLSMEEVKTAFAQDCSVFVMHSCIITQYQGYNRDTILLLLHVIPLHGLHLGLEHIPLWKRCIATILHNQRIIETSSLSGN